MASAPSHPTSRNLWKKNVETEVQHNILNDFSKLFCKSRKFCWGSNFVKIFIKTFMHYFIQCIPTKPIWITEQGNLISMKIYASTMYLHLNNYNVCKMTFYNLSSTFINRYLVYMKRKPRVFYKQCRFSNMLIQA